MLHQKFILWIVGLSFLNQDCVVHGLLDIYIMHLFTSNFKLYIAVLATKLDFLPFPKKYKKMYLKN